MNEEPLGVETDGNGNVALVEGLVFEMHPAAVPLAVAVAQDYPQLDGTTLPTAGDVLLAGILCELRTIGVCIAQTTDGLGQMGQMMQGGLLGKLLGGNRGDGS